MTGYYVSSDLPRGHSATYQ